MESKVKIIYIMYTSLPGKFFYYGQVKCKLKNSLLSTQKGRLFHIYSCMYMYRELYYDTDTLTYIHQ